MANIIKNGAPQAVLHGIDDQSVPPLIPAPVTSPIHLPLIHTYSSKGLEGEAFVVSGDNMFKMYGRDVIDENGKYTTFTTPFLKMFNEQANPIMVQRIMPADAKKASLRVYAETVETDVPQYERNPDGSVKIDSNGQPSVAGNTPGLLIVWRMAEISDDKAIGGARQGKVLEGTLTGTDGKKSKITPIIDLPAPYRGRQANDIGMALSCPNVKSVPAADAGMIEELGARTYTLQFKERPEEDLPAVAMKTLDGAVDLTFSFKQGAFYRPLRLDLDADNVIMPSYRNMNPLPGNVPDVGPVEDFHIYRSNFEALLDLCKQYADPDGNLQSKYLIDPFTGLDVDGNAYNGVVVDSGEEGGEIFSDDHTHFLMGGSDGTMDNDTYDELVRSEMLTFGEGSVNYLNMLKYPCSHYWDAGFTTDTKEAITNFMGRRKDTMVILTTHVYNEGVNDIQTENSMKIALQSMLAAHPESSSYGTPACRGVVMGHSYKLNASAYKEHVPVSYTLAKYTSRYAGSEQSIFKPEYRFDRGELAIVDDGYDINLTYKPFDTRSSDWESGLINVQSYDQYRYFIPALYTVYPEDRSILKGYINTIVGADLERVANRVWAEMSGSSSLTDSQVLKRINEKVIEKTEGKYDGVVDIVPEAYFTPQDKSNGFSVSIKIHMYGQVIKTVHQWTIVAHRRQEG